MRTRRNFACLVVFALAACAGVGCNADPGHGDVHADDELSAGGERDGAPAAGRDGEGEGQDVTRASAGPGESAEPSCSDPEDPPPPDPPPPDPPPALSFLIPVLGVDGGVPAHLATVGDPFISVDSYPTKAERPVLYGALPLGYGGAFSDAYCQQIRTIAETSQFGDYEFAAARRVLREQGGPPARVTLTRLVGSSFHSAAVLAARLAGATAPALEVDNPLELSAARVEIELASDAISNYIGGAQAIAEAINQTIGSQQSFAFSTGYVTFSLHAKDLWCDLAAGKGAINVSFEGQVEGLPFNGTTKLVGVQKL